MRCDDLKDLVPLHVTGLLEGREAEALREHLEGGCPRCAAEVAATAAVLNELPYALPPEEPSPMVRARILARAATESPGERAAATRWRPAIGALAAAVVAAVLTGVLVERRGAIALGDLRGQIARQQEALARQDADLATLRELVRKAGETIRLVSAPGVLVVSLQGQGDRAGSAARVFWDKSAASWQLYAANLPAAPAGKTYQLWLITGKSKISAGVFDPASGAASGTVTVPPGEGPVLAAAVTDEPPGGSPQPTGSILLLGKV
ncbi:MAG TPA: anti-sigma factor [Candidatus Polarisedimenticolia bacterium]|nr:anti-sigma factor [Candidatus Polarisedimenticolia bacterium]